MKRFTELYNHSPVKINFRELFGNYNLNVLPWQWINCTFQGEEYPFRLLSPLPLSVLILFLVLVCHKTWLKSLAIHLWLISKLPFFIVPAANTTPLSFVLRPFSCQQSQIFISCFISGVINRFGRDLIFMRLTELCSHNVSTNNNLLSTSKPTHWHPDHIGGILDILTCLKNAGVVITRMNSVSYSGEMHGFPSQGFLRPTLDVVYRNDIYRGTCNYRYYFLHCNAFL